MLSLIEFFWYFVRKWWAFGYRFWDVIFSPSDYWPVWIWWLWQLWLLSANEGEPWDGLWLYQFILWWVSMAGVISGVALGDANKTPDSGLHRLMATMGLLLQAVRWLGRWFEWWWQNSYKSDWTHATSCAILWPWRQQAFFSAYCWELHCRAFLCYPEFSVPVKHRMTQSPFTWKQHFQTLKSEHKRECDQNLVCVHIWSLPETPRRKKTAWQKLAMLSKYLWGLS